MVNKSDNYYNVVSYTWIWTQLTPTISDLFLWTPNPLDPPKEDK